MSGGLFESVSFKLSPREALFLLSDLLCWRIWGCGLTNLNTLQSLRDCEMLRWLPQWKTVHFAPTVPPPRFSVCLSINVSPRALWSTFQSSPICVRKPAVVTPQAQFRPRHYFSKMVPSSLSANDTTTGSQVPHPTEIKGQSGRQYRIERVLQDKGSLLGRVYLATYVISNTVSGIYSSQ